MPDQGDVHVVPRDGEWAIEVEGADDSGRHETQEQAIAAARSIAQRNGSELLVHGDDGSVSPRGPGARTP